MRNRLYPPKPPPKKSAEKDDNPNFSSIAIMRQIGNSRVQMPIMNLHHSLSQRIAGRNACPGKLRQNYSQCAPVKWTIPNQNPVPKVHLRTENLSPPFQIRVKRRNT